MLLHKDGITVDVVHPVEIARKKALGYKPLAVLAEVEAENPSAESPEEKNAEAIAEANKPIGSKKSKGGEK